MLLAVVVHLLHLPNAFLSVTGFIQTPEENANLNLKFPGLVSC